MNDLYDKPGHAIRRLQQIAVALFIAETQKFDLTPVQYAALFTIRENPGLDATRLSHLIALDRSSLGNVLERLEAKSWVARRPSSDDKRIKLLHLTRKGAAVLVAAEPGVRRCQQRILAPLPKTERVKFMRMMNRLVEGNNDLSRAPAGPSNLSESGKA